MAQPALCAARVAIGLQRLCPWAQDGSVQPLVAVPGRFPWHKRGRDLLSGCAATREQAAVMWAVLMVPGARHREHKEIRWPAERSEEVALPMVSKALTVLKGTGMMKCHASPRN